MAKKAPSKHSRAARRATSPGIDMDKSLKNVKPPTSTTETRPSVLGIHQSAGVTKKTKQGRKSVLSSKARRRQERGLDRAAAVVERTAQKVQRSKSQARTIDNRRKAWDEINSRIDVEAGGARTNEKLRGWAVLASGGSEAGSSSSNDDDDGLDEEMGEAVTEAASDAALAAVAPPVADDGEDEIL